MERRTEPSLADKIRLLPYQAATPLEIRRDDATRIGFEQSNSLLLPVEMLQRHLGILGNSGSGKSRFVQGVCQHLIATGNGVTFIDPHGDTAEALLDYCVRLAARGDETIHDRVHYLEPRANRLFSFDPLAIAEDWDDDADEEFARGVYVRTKARKLIDVLVRRFSGDVVDQMRRLGRQLENAIVAVATPLPSGERLTFADILLLFRPWSPEQKAIVEVLRDRLPEAVRADFELIASVGRSVDQDRYLESSVNNIRAFTDDVTDAIFGGYSEPIDFARILKRREVLLVNLRETNFLSKDTGRSIADFLIESISSAAANASVRERTPHTLFIDEASEYVAEDLGFYLDQARKWKLAIGLIGQQLKSFQRGEVDIGEKLVNHCKLLLSFQQKSLRDVETLGKFFALPNYQLEELMTRQQVDAPENDRFVTSVDHGQSTTSSTSRARNWTQGIAVANGKSNSQSSTQGYGTSTSSGTGYGATDGTGQTFVVIDGEPTPQLTRTFSAGSQDFSGSGSNRFRAFGSGETVSVNRTTSESEGGSEGESQGSSISVTTKQSLVAGRKSIFDPSGNPRFAIPYQLASSEHLLTSLPERCCLARCQIDGVEQTIVLRTPDVPDPLPDTPEADEQREAFLRRLYASRAYLFRPSEIAKSARERVERFLAAADPDDNSSVAEGF